MSGDRGGCSARRGDPQKVVIQDLIWAVYSGDVGDEVGTRSGTCHGGRGGW